MATTKRPSSSERTYAALVDEAMERGTGPAWWYGWAHQVARDAHRFKRLPVPVRPPTLPDNDLALYRALRTYRAKGPRAAAPVRETAAAYGDWVWELEVREQGGTGNLVCLLHALLALQRVNDCSVLEDAHRIVEHVEAEWGFYPLPVPDDPLKLDKLARAKNRRADILPTWLLNNEDPPVFVPEADKEEADD